MPLHVLQLGPCPPPEGGITRNIISIRDELLRRGHRCSIIATSRSTARAAVSDVFHPRTTPALLFRLARLRHDVLHLHIGGDLTKRVLGLALVCTLTSRRSILTLHSGGYPLTDQGRKASPSSLRGMIFRRFSRIIAVSDPLNGLFLKYGVPRNKISVVPPFSLKAPKPGVEIPSELARFFDRHSPVLVAVGGLEKDYQPLFLVSAMEHVRKAFPDAGLVIVGDGSMRRETEKMIAVSGQQDNVVLSGSVDHALSLEFIRRSDVMIRSSLFDGDAISIREALFLGTPVVATDTGERPEGVAVFPIGDREAFIQCLRKVVAAGRPARHYPLEDSSNIAALVDIYEELASSA